MPHTPNNVGVTVAVEVAADDQDASRAEIEFAVQRPCVGMIRRLLVPPGTCDDVGSAIHVDVANTDPVPASRVPQIMLFPFDLRALRDKFVPSHGTTDVWQQVNLPITIDVNQHVRFPWGPARQSHVRSTAV